MQYISRPPGFSFRGETVELLAAGSSLKEQATHIYRALGDCRRSETIVTQVPFPGSTSKVTKWEQQCPAALKNPERVKFKTWIASLFSLCIICQSWIKSAFCPPAASPGVHISLSGATFLWNIARKINDYTFLWKEMWSFFSSFFFLFSF